MPRPIVKDEQPLEFEVPKGPVTSAFRESLDRHLTTIIPPDKTVVALGVMTEDGWAVGFARRVGKDLKLGADLSRWDGDTTGRVYFLWSR